MSRKLRSINHFIEENLGEKGLSGIVTSHGEIMMNLFRAQRLSMKELSERLGKDKSTLTGLVDKLLQFGYVEKLRCPEDGRVSYIVLTDEGRKLKHVFDEISDLLIQEIYAGFSEEEKETLVRLLRKLGP